MEMQTTSEMTPYFTMTKCNKLFITSLLAQLNAIPTLPSSISTISMMVVKTTLFNTLKNSKAVKVHPTYICSYLPYPSPHPNPEENNPVRGVWFM